MERGSDAARHVPVRAHCIIPHEQLASEVFACDNNELTVVPLGVLPCLPNWVDISTEIYTNSIEYGDYFNHIFGGLKINCYICS